MNTLRQITLALATLWAASAQAAPDGARASIARTHGQLSPRTALTVRTLATLGGEAADSVVSVYLGIDPAQLDRDALKATGAIMTLDLGDIATVRVPLHAVASLAQVPGVRYVQGGTPATQMLDIARVETGAQAVQFADGLPAPYTGRGVVVGIVDSGFDYTHAAFRSSDGRLRIQRVWEQTADPKPTQHSPAGFDYGVELDDPDEILAAGGDIRNNSHGSHVASIAAGSDTYHEGVLRGMAPDADIVLVSMLQAGDANVNISNALAYIFDYADKVGKPCVINLSLGSNSGPHDGTSVFDQVADRLQGPGRLIVGASGNNRQMAAHIAARMAAQSAPLRTFIDYKQTPSAKNKGGDIEIWAQTGVVGQAALLVVKTSTNEVVERVVIHSADDPEREATDVSLGRNITGGFAVASETSPLNGKTHILATSGVTSIRTGYALALEITPAGDGDVDVWTETAYLSVASRGVDGYTDASGSTLCEIGGTARRILTVGAYTTRNQYMLLGSTIPNSLNETVGDISSFSSTGPTADGRIKPQVTAPGCYIVGAVSQHDNSGTLSLSHYHNQGGTENYYGYMQGTSMASPMVAGIVATWLEACHDLTPEQLAEVVRSTARQDWYTGDVTAGSVEWGYGKIDALAGIKACLEITGGIPTVTDTDCVAAVVAREASTVTIMLKRDTVRAEVLVYNAQGSLVARQAISGARAGDTVTLAIPKGPHIINIGGQAIKIL